MHKPLGISHLDLYYTLSGLQQEIEKRTSYLGKFRRTEDAQHLLDLISMTRDEGSLFVSFAKNAMTDVYDSLNKFTLHIPKRSEWKVRNVTPINIPTYPTITALTPSITAAIGDDKKSIDFNGTFTITPGAGFNAVDYGVEFKVKFTDFTTKRILSDGSVVTKTNTITITIPKEKCLCTNQTTNTWKVDNYHHVLHVLAPANAIGSDELLDTIPSPEYVANSIVTKMWNPVVINMGDTITIGSDTTIRESNKYTNSNDLNISEDTTPVNPLDIFGGCIHYYLDIPFHIDKLSIAPLDYAISEALVNYIIYQWLMMSFPDGASDYMAQYQSSILSIRNRCAIFNKNVFRKTPRIF